MNAIILAGPAVEPVTLEEMRGYLRIDGTDEDDLVAALIASARLTVEAATRLALIEQRWRITLRCVRRRAIRLPLAPVISVDAVNLVTTSGTTSLVSADIYRLDLADEPVRLLIDDASLDLGRGDAVEVDVTCGFGTTPQAVPPPLTLAIRRLVAAWFEARGDAPDTAGGAGLPADVRALVAPWTRPRLAQ